MVVIDLKKFENLSDTSRNLLLFLASIFVGKLIGPLYGPVLFFICVVVIASKYLLSDFIIQRIAFASVLFIGLSPIYLIARGYLFRQPLVTFDLQIYAMFFIFFCIALAKLSDSKIVSTSLQDKKKITASFFGLLVALLVEILLKFRSIGDAVAWVSSGDSKNHFVNGVTLSELGFLNPQTFLVQPSSSPTYLSLVLSQTSSGIDNAISRMPELMNSYALVWIVLIGILGITFSALTEIVWKSIRRDSREIPLHVLAISSLIPLFSFIVGPALYDGFFSAIFGISSVVVLVSWFFEITFLEKFSLEFLLLSAFLFTCAVTAWMFVIPFTALLVAMGFRTNIKKLPQVRRYVDLLLLFAAGMSVVIVHKSSFVQMLIYKAKLSLTASGAVNASNPVYLFALLAILAICGLIFLNYGLKIGKVLIQLTVFQLVALLAFKKFSNLKVMEWNYYLVKYQWIMLAAIVSIIFAITITVTAILLKNKSIHYATALTLLIFIVFTASESVVSTNNIWQKIWTGWENPRSSVINEALTKPIDRKNPTMFFHYGYEGDAKLANFWLNGFADPIDPIKGWNYTIDTTGDPQQLCDVNAYYPEVTVFTSDSKLEDELAKLCGNEEFNINLEPSLL